MIAKPERPRLRRVAGFFYGLKCFIQAPYICVHYGANPAINNLLLSAFRVIYVHALMEIKIPDNMNLIHCQHSPFSLCCAWCSNRIRGFVCNGSRLFPDTFYQWSGEHLHSCCNNLQNVCATTYIFALQLSAFLSEIFLGIRSYLLSIFLRYTLII